MVDYPAQNNKDITWLWSRAAITGSAVAAVLEAALTDPDSGPGLLLGPKFAGPLLVPHALVDLSPAPTSDQTSAAPVSRIIAVTSAAPASPTSDQTSAAPTSDQTSAAPTSDQTSAAPTSDLSSPAPASTSGLNTMAPASTSGLNLTKVD